MQDWSINDSKQLYGFAEWGSPYFSIKEHGEVAVLGAEHSSYALNELADLAVKQGYSLPVLMRFPHVLHQRVDALTEAFDQAAQHNNYQGQYTAVYPIKVNQQRTVVDEIVRHGAQRVGLEAGSKPELLAVMASAKQGSIIVCNGYKDRAYLRLCLIAQRMGHRVRIVIEKSSELSHLLKELVVIPVRPVLGVRVRLAAIGTGQWQNTGGEKGKFGLSAAQLLPFIERLKESQLLDCLQLMHVHMGSQLSNIRDVQQGLTEAAQFFTALCEAGAAINCVDVGGGLGVDYEGTRSRHYHSMNYGLQEYANNIVRQFSETCNERDLPHPDIITESGRAMTAHHAVLITQVIDRELPVGTAPTAPIDEAPALLKDLWALWEGMNELPPAEVFHDASHWSQEALGLFTHGVINLQQRAQAEQLVMAIYQRLLDSIQPAPRSLRDIEDALSAKLAEKWFVNFSLFQSLPDVWAIDQIFPIIPLQQLHQKPERRAVLQDLTCDSDGRIDRYVTGDGIDQALPVHADVDARYRLGVFLVGAYQEILGDLHNLFGDTHAINVDLDTSPPTLSEIEPGDAVSTLLEYVHYDTDALLRACEEKLQAMNLPENEHVESLDEIRRGLSGYTYLQSDDV